MVARLPDAEPSNIDDAGPVVAPKLTRRRRAAMKAIAVVPTMFTLGNLLCGFFAIFLASRDPLSRDLPFQWSPLTFAALFVFLGMIFDALDGRIARLTHQTSELGEQLDSFSDMVSFGAAPAFMAIMLVMFGKPETPFLTSHPNESLLDRVVIISGGLYVACAALRLARFNIEVASPSVADHMSFKGLPSPGAAGTVVSLVLLHEHFLAPLIRAERTTALSEQPEAMRLLLTKVVVIAVMVLVALAMVSRLRYVHVMNRYFRGREHFNTIVLGLFLLTVVAILPQWTLAAGLVLYAISAPVAWLWYKTFGRKGASDDMLVPDEEGEEDGAGV